MARVDDICRILALQACFNTVVAFWVFFTAFNTASLAVEASASTLGVSLSRNRLARLRGNAFACTLAVKRPFWRVA